MTNFSRILFLDFDGVLHPFARGTFTKLPEFSEWLSANPHISVVISSTWRLLHPLDELKEFFPLAVRHQIVDVTPSLSNTEGSIILAASRIDEIKAWLAQHPQVEKWTALDDEERLFPGALSNVVLTKSAEGFDASHLADIERRLA